MIPKVIHYCWFGKNPYPTVIKKYMESWRKFCPDYKLIEWNEENFDINCNQYVKEAYDAKKWAFVTDYVRLYVLYNYGGIYLDTDVEIIKSIDEFLSYPAFSGFENESLIPTAIMGAHKHSNWIKYLLDYYEDKHFIKPDGTMDLTTNVETITVLTRKKYNIEFNNTVQYVEKEFIIFPNSYFCPKSYLTGKISISDETYTIHHFNASWHDKNMQRERRRQTRCRRVFGVKIGNKILYYRTMWRRIGSKFKRAIICVFRGKEEKENL